MSIYIHTCIHVHTTYAHRQYALSTVFNGIAAKLPNQVYNQGDFDTCACLKGVVGGVARLDMSCTPLCSVMFDMPECISYPCASTKSATHKIKLCDLVPMFA